MKTSEKLSGKNRENIPNWAFNMMSFVMKIMDLTGYSKSNFQRLNIQKGHTVVDYGCGPARYLYNISKAIGNHGKLYATDIHPLAIKRATEKVEKYKLKNVEVIFAKGYSCPIPDNTVDTLLALDMFHMIQDTNSLLQEFARIVKKDGTVIIEDGHQSREETRNKIITSGYFTIAAENKYHVKCMVK